MVQRGVERDMTGASHKIAAFAATSSAKLSWLVERVCALLLLVLVFDVWLGVLARYIIPLPLTFTEEAARYLMIWMALLAVSCGIAHREHIGVELLYERLPPRMRRWVLLAIDLLALTFFALLFWYGLDLVDRGTRSFTMIYGLPKALPFAAVPVAAALACVQLALVAIRDQVRFGVEPGAGAIA
jgi:TRAP-type C4-dicarboxylate transport system permease small subunit